MIFRYSTTTHNNAHNTHNTHISNSQEIADRRNGNFRIAVRFFMGNVHIAICLGIKTVFCGNLTMRSSSGCVGENVARRFGFPWVVFDAVRTISITFLTSLARPSNMLIKHTHTDAVTTTSCPSLPLCKAVAFYWNWIKRTWFWYWKYNRDQPKLLENFLQSHGSISWTGQVWSGEVSRQSCGAGDFMTESLGG